MNAVAVSTNAGTSHEVYSGKTPNLSVLTNQKSDSPAPEEVVEPAIAYPPSEVATNEPLPSV